MKRRSLLAGTAAAGIVGLSGCLSTVLGGLTSLESTPAGVRQSALESTGYESTGVEAIVTEEEVNVAGQSEVIAVTSYLTEYEKTIGIEAIAEQAVATFAILSTPKLDVFGQTLNPVEEMSPRELVDLIADNYDNLSGIEHDTDKTVTVLEQSIIQSRFTAQASLSGVPIDLNLHVTEAVERGEDLLVTVGVYPRQFQTAEAANIRELAESVRADVEPDTESTNESSDTDSTQSESTGNESDSDTDSTENESSDADSSETESTENDSDGTINVTGSIQSTTHGD